jgi:hypothetical protein
MRRFDFNDFLVAGFLTVGFLIFGLVFTIPAHADEDSSWYTVNGHVRAVYYDPKNWRTHLVFETDAHQVLDVNLLTQAAYGPPPVWVGEYIKLDYGHRYTNYEDKPFLKYEVTPLAEAVVSQPTIVTVPACVPPRRKHHTKSVLKDTDPKLGMGYDPSMDPKHPLHHPDGSVAK